MKNMTGTTFVLELVPFRGENKFEPRPQKEMLVPIRGSLQNFQKSSPSLLYGCPPWNYRPYGHKIRPLVLTVVP